MIERGGDCCFEPVAKDAAVLKAAFAVALDYWLTIPADDAVGMARNAMNDAAELEEAANAKAYDRAVAAEGAILQSCEPCHERHRVKHPDGSFAIK
jgi:hypothetical protein